MKKTILLIKTCIVLFSLYAGEAVAQLSGLYTINSAAATAGTNYQTFNDFANDINTNGISGPVTVNVVSNSGPYNEQVLFNDISGASNVNRVTINGNGNLLTFNSSNTSQRYVMGLNGTDWLAVNDLNIEGTGTYAFVCLLYGGANNNLFSSCTFSVPSNATSSNQIPVVVSGSPTSYATAGNSGNNNTWVDCQMYSGWACITFYGPNSGIRDGNNSVINCQIEEFYSYGIRSYYQWFQHFKGNTIERLNRTSFGTTYGIYGYYMQGSVIEENRIQKLYNSAVNASETTYCMYFYNYFSPAPPAGGEKNVCRNNIVSDIKNNGSLYGIYASYFDGDISHNTISLDHTGATTGTTYGIRLASQAGQETSVQNNLVTIGRGGASTKYGIYSTSASFINIDYNNIFISSTSGTNYHGYYGSQQLTFANWQSAGADINGFNLDPMYTSLALNDLRPTNVALNNQGTPLQVVFDADEAVRNQSTPDIGALEFMTPVCAGAPASNTVVGPTFAICPGESVNLGLQNLVADAGLSYQWQVSNTSNVGPWNTLPGETGIFYTAPNVTANTWYSIVMSCSTAPNSTVMAVGSVVVSGPTSSTVPYFEGFEGIGKVNRLPNCSWSATEPGLSNLTFTSSQSGNRVPNNGTSFASFSNQNPGTSYYFTNPIQMNAGVTYSAALYFATEYFGANNWTELSILVGPNQNTTGLVQVASESPAISGPYKLLDNTFTVPASGTYYVAIRATSTSGNATYLSWDDLSITIPCGLGSVNSPTMSISASASTICAGTQINITANGADTYSWSSGDNSSSIVASPGASTTFTVFGTNSLSGCTSILTQYIHVNPSPNVFIIANKPVACPGEEITLTGYGANSYMWANNGNGPMITVTPTASSSYTVIGVGANGCSATYVQQINVAPAPSISISSSHTEACKDDVVTITASGGNTYQWTNNLTSELMQGNMIGVSPQSNATYSVVVTGTNGCQSKGEISLLVSECTGLGKNGTFSQNIRVYPNPFSDVLKIESADNNVLRFELTDVSGRVLRSGEIVAGDLTLTLRDLANGIYCLTLKSQDEVQKVKIVKQ